MQVTPEDNSFVVEIPAELELEKTVHTNLTELGEIDFIVYKSNTFDDIGNRYVLSYIDYHPTIHLDILVKDSMLLESVAGLPGNLLYQNSEKLQGISVLTARKKIEETNTHLKTRLFFIENRFYMLIVYSFAEKSTNKRIDKFLDSFQVI